MNEQTKTCGQCSHYKPYPSDGIAHGYCYRYPPTVVWANNRDRDLRPLMRHNERACGEFKAGHAK